MRYGRRPRWAYAAALAFVASAACSRAPRELLFVYSGDCQGYVEPCG
jgi:hypothetical protein